MKHVQRVEFTGSGGDTLAARLDRPPGPVAGYAIFAHCFTCSKDLFAAQRIASELAMRGIGVLRFDFTGLGASQGEFANTNFSSNVEDLVRAAAWLREHVGPADILIGHSLGGAAVLAAAGDLPDVRAVATIGAPADTEHVIKNFRAKIPAIESAGEAEVELAGRHFTIRRQFLDDVRSQHLGAKIAQMRKPLLVMHAPTDEVVGIENARLIYDAARHPKSFVSLDGADHLLRRREDAAFVAEIVTAWSHRYLPAREQPPAVVAGVRVRATGEGTFPHAVRAGRHGLRADEPVDVGGLDTGPTPYDFVAIGLAACTSMTLRLYAERKGWSLPPFAVDVLHGKVHAKDCAECEGREGRIDRFERRIAVEGGLDDAQRGKLLEIASKCPVHRTLEASSVVVTKIDSDA